MRVVHEVLERVRALVFRSREERELEEELRFHIEMETQANVRRGLKGREARRRAMIAFGGVERYRAEVREARGLGVGEALAREVRFAVRRLVREPGFSVPAVITLALGIGATAAILALVNAVLLRPLPYPDASRLVSVQHAVPGFGVAAAGQSGGTYQHYRENNRVFEEMGVHYESSQILTDGDRAERIDVAMVTPSTFALLGAVPLHGRPFTEEDPQRDAWVVMISHDLWVRRYGADPSIVGGRIQINSGEPREVVGIMPPDFDFPSPTTDLWWGMAPDAEGAGLSELWMQGLARLRAGVRPEDAQADLDRLIRLLPDAYSDATPALLEAGGFRPIVTPLKRAVIGDADRALMLLLVTAGFVLLIALANAANLFLIRSEVRQREIGVSRALGAGTRQLGWRFATETLVLTGVAGVLAFALAVVGVESRFGLAGGRIPRLHELALDGFLPGVVLALTLASTVLLATIAMAAAARSAGGGIATGAAGRATGGRGTRRVQRVLVAWQIALALMLLVGSALMAQSVRRLQQIELGFEPADLLTFEVVLPTRRYLRYHDAAAFHVELSRRLETMPGVRSAGAGGVFGFPLTPTPSFDPRQPIIVEDRPMGPDELPAEPIVDFATADYFGTMRIPVLAGRAFRPGDLDGAIVPVVLSEALNRRLFGGEDALGRRLLVAGRPGRRPFVVVGVVGNVTGKDLTAAPAEVLYVPVLSWADRETNPLPLIPARMTYVVRTALPPLSMARAVREIVLDMDSTVPIVGIRTMDAQVAAAMGRTRVTMLLLSIAAATALALGVVGIYGILAYSVSQRIPELGVRLALGADPGRVARMVLRQAAALALAGILVGGVAALALTRLLGSLLYRVSPTDPLAYVTMAGLLLGVALAAGYIPARRASRVDPVRALRAE